MDDEKLARALGWFSLGLGLAHLLVPKGLSQLIGVHDDDKTQTVLRAVGLREIASGGAILTQPNPIAKVWVRVAGDVTDLALLGAALDSTRNQRNRVAAAIAVGVGVTALDLYCATRPRSSQDTTAGAVPRDQSEDVRRAITINREPNDVYQFWRDFENLPRFMNHLESVESTSDKRSTWTAKAPAGRTVSWDAEIVADEPNQRIAWTSVEGADIANSGSVRFAPAPGSRGTEVRVELRYAPPAGALGATVAKLFGEEPSLQIREDLLRLKQVLETGEVVRSDGTIHGSRARQHPAQPQAEADLRSSDDRS
jgi:uncharacterized membrane protein